MTNRTNRRRRHKRHKLRTLINWQVWRCFPSPWRHLEHELRAIVREFNAFDFTKIERGRELVAALSPKIVYHNRQETDR